MVEKICNKCGEPFIPAPDDEQAEECYKCKNKYCKRGEKYCLCCGKKIENIRGNRQFYCDACAEERKRLKELKRGLKYCICCGKKIENVHGNRQMYCDECREKKDNNIVKEKLYTCICCGKDIYSMKGQYTPKKGNLFVCTNCRKNNRPVQITFKEPEDLQNYKDVRMHMIKKEPPVYTDQFFIDGLKKLRENGIIK